jgi:hypothetical protein
MQGRELLSLVPGKLPGCMWVRLNLSHRPLFIGELREQGEGSYFKKIDPTKHVHENSRAIAVSAALLHLEHFHFRWIVCELPDAKLVTTRRYMLAHGEAFRYRNYEPQVFLPLDHWGREKALTWEAEQDRRERMTREKAAQLSIFDAAA